jgi:tRNA-binding EMAP/Myf-like protein
MPIIAMQATSAAEHPNADTLAVYNFEAPGRAAVQIVANQEHVYAVGDVAAIALVGTTLLDGTKIRRAKLRGVESLGMAMGPAAAPSGTDLSEGRCLPEYTLDTGHHLKWTSIELLHNVRGNVVARAELEGEPPPTIGYRAKVKLHGTNSGVQILPDGGVVAQGRNQVLSLDEDNAGFAAWVAQTKAAFETLASADRHLTLFGEWCGAGIQKGVAICGIGRKVFVIFAAQIGNHHAEAATLVTEPNKLAELTPKHPDILVLPWHGEAIALDFGAPEAAVATLNAMVEAVESNDPWVQEIFGVAGTGEGLVLYPQIESTQRDDVAALLFKAKGDKHRVRKAKKAVEVAPEVARSVEAFVATFATEARLAQGLAEACPAGASMKQMGAFLKWVSQDVRKESVSDLEAAGLEWGQVAKAITNAARLWFRANL